MGVILSFDRGLAEELGISAALLYQELLRKHLYWQKEEQLVQGEFWCDQGKIEDWLLMSHQTLQTAANRLEEAGLVIRRGGYRPNTSRKTTWWKVIPIVENRNFRKSKNLTNGKSKNLTFYNKADTEADTDGVVVESNKRENKTTESVSVESVPESLSIPVVRVEKWDFDSKGNWKRKRTVYTTIEEADKIEGADRDEWVAFSFWPSPPLVGQMDKAKTMNEKRTKLKTEYPDSPDSESQEVFHYEGI